MEDQYYIDDPDFADEALDVGEDFGEGALDVGEDIGEGALDVGEDIGEGAINVGETVIDNAPNAGRAVISGVSDIGSASFSGIKTFGSKIGTVFNKNSFASLNEYFFTVIFFVGSTLANSIKQHFLKIELLELQRATAIDLSTLTNKEIEEKQSDNEELLRDFKIKEKIISSKGYVIKNKVLMSNVITIILRLIGMFSMPAMLLGICESTSLLWNTVNNIAMLKNEFNIFDITSIILYFLGFIGIVGSTPIQDDKIEEDPTEYFFNIYKNNKQYMMIFGAICVISILFIGFIKNTKQIGGGNHIFTAIYTIACACIATIKFFLYKVLDNINKASTSIFSKIFNISFIFVIILISVSGMIINNLNSEIFENVFVSLTYTPIYYLIYIVLTFFHCLIVFKTDFFNNESKTMVYFGGMGAFVISIIIMIVNSFYKPLTEVKEKKLPKLNKKFTYEE